MSEILLLPGEVEYDDSEHKYSHQQERYTSATQLIEHFVEPFNAEEQAEQYAYKHGGTAEYWLEKWGVITRVSHKRGNLTHSQQEDYLHNRGFAPVSIDGSSKIFRVYNLQQTVPLYRINSYYDLPDGIYPEMKLWRHDVKIAGRADKPIIESVRGKRYMHIEDYKTNRKIDTQGFVNLKTGEEQMMLHVLSHIPDSEYWHYALQLSLYQFMAESFGFLPGYRRLIHFPHPIPGIPGDPSPVPHELPYLRDEVKAMISYYNNHLRHAA